MPVRKFIAGPPGTGKTTRLLEIVSQELDAGTRIDQIAYVAFGRAAAHDVRERVIARWGDLAELTEFGFRGFKTIHALAYEILSLRPERVMGPKHWAEFGLLHNYRFTGRASVEEGLIVGPTRTKDDQLRTVYDWGRNLRIDRTRALARSSLRVSPFDLARFVDRYESYKKQHRLLDFVDMLEEILRKGLRAFFAIAFVDEAQDLSPLQVEVVAHWFRHCDSLYVAGDDDQAIYGFQGANAGWLLDFAKTAQVEILAQSWRVPRAVHAVAEVVIRRNKQRIEKAYRPRGAAGRVEWATLHEAVRSLDTKVQSFVIARNRCFLEEVAAMLRRLGVPFLLEGGACPLDPERGVGRALRIASAIGRGEPVIAGDLAAMLTYVPSRRRGLVPRGMKAEVGRMKARDLLMPAELGRLLGEGALLRTIASDGPASVLLKASGEDLDYVQRVFTKHGSDADTLIRLTTVHGAKGREADMVVVLPDMTRATYDASRDRRYGGYEAENRVGYVALTRSKDRLVLVRPRLATAFAYPTSASCRASIGAKEAQGNAAA